MQIFLSFLVPIVLMVGLILTLGLYGRLWLEAYFSGTDIRFVSLISMSLKNIDPRVIVQAKIIAVQAGLAPISTEHMEAQYLAGGNLKNVMIAMVSAQRAGIDLDWITASAIDLAGRDIKAAVDTSVNPRVIQCPEQQNASNTTLDAVAQDGIQLKVRVSVTVRTNLARLIGGANELTIIARVGQGIVTAVGACADYRDVLSDPSRITRQVLLKGLDSQTSLAIVSIDVSSIAVGVNIGSRLRLEQANADILVACAAAEERKAMAIARQHEMFALTGRNQARLILAQSLVPSAIAHAIQLHTPFSRTLEDRSHLLCHAQPLLA
ncbi:MAG: flotillin-like FloA family protein [Pirellula sp.]|jgi:uncharacterized protein YqfA (UPF0365 family)|nr:flotillin-like FloA family protein [Pirellula sp.]